MAIVKGILWGDYKFGEIIVVDEIDECFSFISLRGDLVIV